MSYPRLFTTPGLGAFAEAVDDERHRQLAKWGDQRHPDGTGGPVMRQKADEARAQCQYLAENGGPDWRAILLEEVYEAMAEDDPKALRAELVQSAAVIQAWISDLDRRAADEAQARVQDWVNASGVYDDMHEDDMRAERDDDTPADDDPDED